MGAETKREELVDEKKLEELAKSWIHGDYAVGCSGVPVGLPVDLERVQRMAQRDPEGLLVMVFKAGARFVLEEIGVRKVVELPAEACKGWCEHHHCRTTGWCALEGVCTLRPAGPDKMHPSEGPFLVRIRED